MVKKQWAENLESKLVFELQISARKESHYIYRVKNPLILQQGSKYFYRQKHQGYRPREEWIIQVEKACQISVSERGRKG
ncbi:MAG: hypothetical protein VX830_02820 [Candidatus Poribacteria bacterium]|nr:hypothetical protein [Candidatus Poribacteria bacterium]